MLKRIQDLKSIGCFFDDHPARIQFEQLTIIFGENCYGKSTLCDIFRSLADNDPSHITDRRSVPNPNDQSQSVQINFSPSGNTGGEVPVSFSADKWNSTLPGDLKIHVFDTDFIHRNVFTGLTIERKNQENITQFVLGEAGVQTAKEIKELNSQLRAIKKEIRQLRSNSFEGIDDIVAFSEMKVDETSIEIDEKISRKAIEHKEKKDLGGNLEKVKARNEPKLLSILGDIKSFVEQVNACLLSSYHRAHDDASKAVEAHIKEKTQNSATTKNWLKSGLNHIAGKFCPFCGQALEDEGKRLIDIYRTCFDEAFREYEQRMLADLGKMPSQMDTFKCLTVPELIELNSSNVGIYPEIGKAPIYKRRVKLVNAEAKGLRKIWDAFQIKFNEESKNLSEKIGKKEKAVYIDAPPWTCTDLITAYENLKLLMSKYNNLLQKIIDQIANFKGKLNPETITKEISEIEKQQKELQIRKRRKDSETVCMNFLRLILNQDGTEKKICKLKEQLETEQSQFLDTCFRSVNDLFERIGSRQFRISKQMSGKGNMPVIEMTASYAGVTISQDKLKAFFSESDRRALALSIFWAKIHSMNEQQRQNAILILDDPVTSFDDGRIDRTIRLMEADRTSFQQLIILSHYSRYLKAFFERASLITNGIQLCKIVRKTTSSVLDTASPTDFVETDHQVKFRHIKGFIDHQHTENVCQDLRIFLETEVRSRYRKQIVEMGLNEPMFKDLLDKLLESSIIDQAQRDELEGFRLSLNPEHHIWTERSHEDRIGLCSDVMDLIYERL